MDPQEPLLDELACGDSTKQTNALTRLINLAANGRDISIYFNHIVQYCLTPNDHKLKLLAYRVLKRCNLIDSEWEQKVVPHIARDSSNEDQNLAIAALELILHIPVSSILVDFVGKVIFSPTFNHPAPAVRRASIETLSYLLLHKQVMLSSKALVTSFWTSILGRLLDDTSPIVFQVAFRAVSNLFEAVDNLSPLDNVDSFGDGFYETRTHQLQRTVAEVKSQLIPHFDLLLKRVDFLELPFRAPAVNVLTCLVIEIPKDPILQAKVAPALYPAIATGGLISNFVESYLLPLLTHADDGLAFACGKAILRIWETKESHRRDWAISATLALVGILRRETIAISPSSVITEILKVLHLIPEAQLIPCTLKLLTSIADFTESQQRCTALSQVFTLLVVKDLKRGEGEGGEPVNGRPETRPAIAEKKDGEERRESQPRRVQITHEHVFLDLFKDKWLIDVWTTEAPFREELLLAMVTEYSKFKARYLDTKTKHGLTDRERFSYLISSMKFIQLCNDTLMWRTADRSHAVEQYVRFIDWQLEHVKYLPKTEDYDPIWQLQTQCLKNLLAQMAEIVSDGICLQIIFIVCKYSSELEQHDEQAIISTLQQRFLLLGETVSYKEHARAAAKAGSLMDMSILKLPETPFMQGVLECLHILGVRFPKMANVIRQTLDDISTSHPSNEPLVKRIRALQTKLKACQNQGNNPKFAFGAGVTDFSLCPPIEHLDSLNFDSPNDKFTLDYKKSSSPHSKPVHSKHTPQTPHTHKILSGSSDPFFVAASHLMRPDLYSILLRVRIRNQMSFTYTNLSVSIGLCGALQPCDGYDTPQTIKKIAPEEKVDLEFPILVTSFEMGSATVHLSYSSLSPGDVALELETSLDYEDYGKNYASTSVVSDVYGFEVGEFLHPLEYSPSEFFSEWNRFPAGFILDVAFDPSIESTEILLEKLASHTASSFQQVLRLSYSENYFQLAYSAMTWFEDQLCFTVLGQQPPSSEQIYARFAFRASDPLVLSIFHGQIDRWLNSCAGVGKFSFITNVDENIFCATAGEDDPKLGSDELYEVEEGLLKQWKKTSRYTKPAPPIPAPPPKPVEAPPPAPAPAPPPPPPLPITDDDFL